MAQSHENPDDANMQTLVNEVCKEKDDGLKQKLEEVKKSIPQRARRAIVCPAKRVLPAGSQ